MIDPIDDPTNYKWGILYYNEKDTRVVVRKRVYWLGWTFNFARPETYLILVLIVVAVSGFRFF